MKQRSDSSVVRSGIVWVAAGLVGLALLLCTGMAAVADEPGSPESASEMAPDMAKPKWSVIFLQKPIVLSTERSSELKLTVHNPKGDQKLAVLPMTFKKGQKVLFKWGITTLPVNPGDNAAFINVPPDIAQQAKAAGADRAIVKLSVGGIARAHDTVLIDFDLQANASADPASGAVPLEVHFTGHAQGGKEPWSYAWDFGDGQISTSQNPVHTYTTAGYYTAALTVTDGMGGTAKETVNISTY